MAAQDLRRMIATVMVFLLYFYSIPQAPPCHDTAASWSIFRYRRPPFRPASRASSDVNSWAVPFSWAAFPPFEAISRCRSGSIPAKPRPFFCGITFLWLFSLISSTFAFYDDKTLFLLPTDQHKTSLFRRFCFCSYSSVSSCPRFRSCP